MSGTGTTPIDRDALRDVARFGLLFTKNLNLLPRGYLAKIQGGGVFNGRHDALGVFVGAAVRQEVILHGGGMAGHDGDDVAEVVDDIAGQFPEGLHFLGLPQPIVGRPWCWTSVNA